MRLLTDPVGRLVWASPALPGVVHDVTAARTVGLIDALTGAGVKTFADKGYQGVGGTIRTPFKRHRHRPWLSRGQRDVNRSHARIRAIGERAIATLKSRKVLTKLRCSPRRATALVRAILVLQLVEAVAVKPSETFQATCSVSELVSSLAGSLIQRPRAGWAGWACGGTGRGWRRCGLERSRPLGPDLAGGAQMDRGGGVQSDAGVPVLEVVVDETPGQKARA